MTFADYPTDDKKQAATFRDCPLSVCTVPLTGTCVLCVNRTVVPQDYN